jgi:hypothetical protein
MSPDARPPTSENDAVKQINALSAQALVEVMWTHKGQLEYAAAEQAVRQITRETGGWSEVAIRKAMEVAAVAYQIHSAGEPLTNLTVRSEMERRQIPVGDGKRLASVIGAAKARAAQIPLVQAELFHHPRDEERQGDQDTEDREERERPEAEEGGPQSTPRTGSGVEKQLALLTAINASLATTHQAEVAAITGQCDARVAEMRRTHRQYLISICIIAVLMIAAASAITGLWVTLSLTTRTSAAMPSASTGHGGGQSIDQGAPPPPAVPPSSGEPSLQDLQPLRIGVGK